MKIRLTTVLKSLKTDSAHSEIHLFNCVGVKHITRATGKNVNSLHNNEATGTRHTV